VSLLLWIVITLAAIAAALAFGLSRVYRNPRTIHRRTPRDLGIGFAEVRFPTRNHRELYGWWVPAERPPSGEETPPTVLLVHGWGRNVERVLDYIDNLHPRGFNLLAFDSRNHGSSDKDRFSSMLKFAEDIMAAIDFVVDRPQVDPGRLGVVGLSIGGAAAVYAAAHDRRIGAVVTVGAFAHPVDIMRAEFARRGVPAGVIAPLFRYFEWRIGVTFDDLAPENNITRATARFLIVHGREDEVVLLDQAKRLMKAANPPPAELWILPGRGHSDCHQHPGFWSKVTAFLWADP